MPDYLKHSDAELIALCQQGDADAWETLVRRYQRLIASITFKFRLSAEDAQDIYQTVCLHLLRQLGELRRDAKLSSWLITVTVRECWKLRERGKNTDRLDEEQWAQIAEAPDQALPLPEEEIFALERQHQIRRAVEQMSEQCRELIRLMFYQETPPSYVEISRALGITVSSIGPIRGRCLERLRKILNKSGFA